MTSVKMLYQCNCGKFILIEGKESDEVCVRMEQAVIDHEDNACG
jgi:hypothetical protein